MSGSNPCMKTTQARQINYSSEVDDAREDRSELECKADGRTSGGGNKCNYQPPVKSFIYIRFFSRPRLYIGDEEKSQEVFCVIVLRLQESIEIGKTTAFFYWRRRRSCKVTDGKYIYVCMCWVCILQGCE